VNHNAPETIPHSRPTIGPEEIAAVREVLLSGTHVGGSRAEALEAAVGAISQQPYVAATNSGTAALHLALLALGVGPGDEVVMPSYVCQALLNAVNYVGARPRLVDICLHDYNLSVDAVSRALSPHTAAVIVPHMFGLMAEVNRLTELGVPVIEDCAMAIGATLQGQPAGSFGDLGVFSFYATKMIAGGEGGAVAGRNPELIETVRNLREYDSNALPYRVRYNYRISDLHAAVAVEQLKKLAAFIVTRRELAQRYTEELCDTGLLLPTSHVQREHVYYRYIVRCPHADDFRDHMARKGIACGRGVAVGLHRLLGREDGFPNTDLALGTCVSLPIYPTLTSSQQDTVIAAIREWEG